MQTLLTLLLGLAAISAYCEDLDVDTIIQRSVEANQADWKAAPEYECLDTQAADKKPSKTYDGLMILGSPYRRLVAVDGKLLSPVDEERQEQQLRGVIAQRNRESKQERERRIANYEHDRKRDHLLMEQLTEAFDFKLLGKQMLDSREVYVLVATPRPGYSPPNAETKVLTGMHGKLWIDTKELQWVKVEAEAIRPVSIEGFLARVEPGTQFELEKAPVAPGVWLVKHFAMRSRAKFLFLFPVQMQGDDSYSQCHLQDLNVPAEVSASQNTHDTP